MAYNQLSGTVDLTKLPATLKRLHVKRNIYFKNKQLLIAATITQTKQNIKIKQKTHATILCMITVKQQPIYRDR